MIMIDIFLGWIYLESIWFIHEKYFAMFYWYFKGISFSRRYRYHRYEMRNPYELLESSLRSEELSFTIFVSMCWRVFLHLWIPYYEVALVSLGSTIYWFKSRCLQRPFKLMDGFIVVHFVKLCLLCLDLEYLEYIKFVIFLFLPFWTIAISLLALFRTWRTCFSWCFLFSVLMQVFWDGFRSLFCCFFLVGNSSSKFMEISCICWFTGLYASLNFYLYSIFKLGAMTWQYSVYMQ